MTDKQEKGKEAKDAGQHRQQKRHWQKKQHRNDHKPKKDKDPEEIPVLKYGPSTNFTRFKEAISKAALRDYGHLGKLIKTGQYFKPTEPNIADYDLVNDPYGIQKATFLEDVKEHRKELLKMHTDRPKLYALMLQYLSEESLDEIKRSDKWEDIEKKTDPLELWLLIEDTHKVNSISKVEEVTKLAARSTYNSKIRRNKKKMRRRISVTVTAMRVVNPGIMQMHAQQETTIESWLS